MPFFLAKHETSVCTHRPAEGPGGTTTKDKKVNRVHSCPHRGTPGYHNEGQEVEPSCHFPSCHFHVGIMIGFCWSSSLQSRSRAIAPGAVVPLAVTITAGVYRTLAAHTVAHGATCAANGSDSRPARLVMRALG